MRCIGIDLAWGERATTAVVALEGDAVLDWRDALGADDEILAFVDSLDDGGPLLIGIDAPTCVPNESGRRPVDGLLSRAMRRWDAGPHPANRRLLSRADGSVRGERLVDALTESNIHHTPAHGVYRACFEVYPHPAHVALFGLEKTLKYKAKSGRTRADRNAAFVRYADLLHTLPLNLPGWTCRDPATMTVSALKRHEDALDALTCAYIARLHGLRQTYIAGDEASGHTVFSSVARDAGDAS